MRRLPNDRAGYVSLDTAGHYTSVSASWVQPAGTCTSKKTLSSFWVGIDGVNKGTVKSKTVEQTGTEVDCPGGSDRTPTYYAWYDLFPGPQAQYGEKVDAGDTIVASVSFQDGKFTLAVIDIARHWTTRLPPKADKAAARNTAEVVVEAPFLPVAVGGSTKKEVQPLTNFGTVTFASALVNDQPLSKAPGLLPIDMKSVKAIIATTGSLEAAGTQFTVAWKGYGVERPY